MKIIVTVKPVPDTTALKSLDRHTLRLVRTATTVLNPFDEFAIEAALRLRDQHAGSTVTLLAIAPESAREALRKAMGMGADAAVLVADPALTGLDGRGTSIVLEAAVKLHAPDVILCGMRSSDAGGGYIHRMLAQRLGVPALLGLRQVEIHEGRLRGERLREGVLKHFETSLPALAGITKEIGAVRYPSLKGIMAAKNKPLMVITTTDLGLSVERLRPFFDLVGITPRPARAAATVLQPETPEAAARAILDFLTDRKALS